MSDSFHSVILMLDLDRVHRNLFALFSYLHLAVLWTLNVYSTCGSVPALHLYVCDANERIALKIAIYNFTIFMCVCTSGGLTVQGRIFLGAT